MTPDASCGGARLETVCSRIHRLEFDVPWPPKHVAAYLLEGPEPILIDAGAPDETGGSDRVGETELREGLAEVDAVPADIDHVLVTHIHSDHIGQLPALRAAGATVHAPKAGLARLETDLDTVRAGLRETARSAGYDDDLETVLEEELDSRRRDRRLVDGESARPIDPTEPFAVGGREFRVFETPGHEIDHLCFETTVEGVDVLFAGDALIEPFRAGAFHVGFDRGAYEAVDAYYEAMDRLQARPRRTSSPATAPSSRTPSESSKRRATDWIRCSRRRRRRSRRSSRRRRVRSPKSASATSAITRPYSIRSGRWGRSRRAIGFPTRPKRASDTTRRRRTSRQPVSYSSRSSSLYF